MGTWRLGAWRFLRHALVVAACCAIAVPALAATKPARDGKTRSDSKGKAEAKPEPGVWSLVRGEDTYVLRFAPPRAADPLFAVACQPRAQLIQFTVEVPAGKVKAGDGVPLSLAAGKRRLELAASAFRGGTEGRVVVEAAVTLDDRVLALFSEGETLSVKMPGASDSYPLAGAKGKVGDFRKACFAGK